MTVFRKAGAAVLDFAFDWSAWLDGDLIVTSSWRAPSGLSIVKQAHSASGAVVWIGGGVAGVEYPVTNQITTADGRSDARTLLVKAER